MKIYLFVATLILSTGTILTAQNVDLPTDYIRNTLNGNSAFTEPFQGSPYPEENFQEGTVKIGNKSFKTLARYNGLTDAFEIKNPAGEITTLLRRSDITIEVNGKNFEIMYYNDEDGNSRQGYFQKLNDGKTMLLKKQGVNKIAAVKATSSYGRDRPAKLEQYEKYFIKTGDSPAKEVRLRRKDILKEIDNEKVKSFVRENKFRLENEAEVIQTIEFADSIQ